MSFQQKGFVFTLQRPASNPAANEPRRQFLPPINLDHYQQPGYLSKSSYNFYPPYTTRRVPYPERQRPTGEEKKIGSAAEVDTHASIQFRPWERQYQQDVVAKLLKDESLVNRYQFPGSINMAKQHAKTKYFGTPTDKRCPCCQRFEKKRLQSIFQDPQQLLHQQENKIDKVRGLVAVTFFFKFVIYLIMMMIFRILIVDLYNIYTSYSLGTYCAGGQCEDVTFLRMVAYQVWSNSSIYHKVNVPDIIQIVDVLSFITVIALIGFTKLYRVYLFRKNIKLDENIIDQSDYSVFVTGIPIFNTKDSLRYTPSQQIEKLFEQKIQNWLQIVRKKHIPGSINQCQNQMQRIQYKCFQLISEDADKCVAHVDLCYDISPLIRLDQLRKKAMNNLEDIANNEILPQKQARDFANEKILQLNKFEILLSLNYNRGARDDRNLAFFSTTFLGSAFVTFKYEHYRDYILQAFQEGSGQFTIKGKQLHIQRASHPADIRWENLTVDHETRKQRIKYGNYIMACVLVVSFIILGFLNYWKNRFFVWIFDTIGGTYGASDIWNYTTTLFSIFITIVNTFLTSVSERMVKWEGHVHSTEYFKSHLLKLVPAHFINSVLSLFIASMVFQSDAGQFIGKKGLVAKVSNFLVVDAFKKIIFQYIGADKVKNKINSIFLGGIGVSGSSNVQDKDFLFQANLNKQHQEESFDLVEKYTYYINQIFLVSFSAYVAPICVPLVAIILTIMYWKDKSSLYKTSSFDFDLNYNFTRHAISIAQASIAIYAVGIVIFSMYKVNGYQLQVHPLNLIGAGIAVFYSFMSYILEHKTDDLFLTPLIKKERVNKKAHSANYFQRSYQLLNPASRISRFNANII